MGDAPNALQLQTGSQRAALFQTLQLATSAAAGTSGSRSAPQPKRPRANSADPIEDPSMQQILLAQLEILRSMQSEQEHTKIATEARSLDVNALLKGTDSLFAEAVSTWYKEFNNQIKDLANAAELASKYEKINQSGELLKAFSAEADRPWQFPKSYLGAAVTPPGYDTHGSPYKIMDMDHSRALRPEHARDCHDFSVLHNKAAAQIFQDRLQYSEVDKSLRDV